MLYELATGRLPFVGDTATQTIDQICHATPIELGASRKDVPAELQRIVRKCLEKERDRRYASARDLVVDLRNLQRDRVSSTSPVAAPQHPGRKRLVVLGSAGLVAVLAVGAGLVYRSGARGASIGSVAVLPFENAAGDPAIEYLSDGISESLINKLSSLPGLRVISRTSAFAFKGKKLGQEGSSCTCPPQPLTSDAKRNHSCCTAPIAPRLCRRPSASVRPAANLSALFPRWPRWIRRRRRPRQRGGTPRLPSPTLV